MLSEISTNGLIEWMAFHRLKDPKFREEIEQSLRTPEEQEEYILKRLKEIED
jgi:hypothetical protein